MNPIKKAEVSLPPGLHQLYTIEKSVLYLFYNRDFITTYRA